VINVPSNYNNQNEHTIKKIRFGSVINTIYILANLPKTSNSNSALRCIPIQIQILHMIKYQIQMTNYSICSYMLTYFLRVWRKPSNDRIRWPNTRYKWEVMKPLKCKRKYPANDKLQKFRLIIVLIIVMSSKILWIFRLSVFKN
jgi:hypothetical protein